MFFKKNATLKNVNWEGLADTAFTHYPGSSVAIDKLRVFPENLNLRVKRPMGDPMNAVEMKSPSGGPLVGGGLP